MSDEQLTVESVQVRRAPGFDSSGFGVEELSEGVNIVHGPNGSGKSTLARSIHGVLWPQSVDTRYSLLGRFTIGDDDWRLDRDGTGVRFQQNGADANQPGLPSSTQRDRYYLSLHDLLQEDTTDDSFAKQIQQESIGGYDLEAAHRSLGFTDKPSTRGISEFKRANKAYDAWQKAKNEAEELKQEEARLNALESQLREAKAASWELKALDDAIAYHEAKEKLREAEEQLEPFSPVLSEATGHEIEQVQELNSDIERAEAERRTASEARADAESTLESLRLPSEGIPAGELDGLKTRLDRLKSLETDRDRLTSELEQAKARREAALEDTPLETDSDLSTLDPAAWKDVTEFGEQASALRESRDVREAVGRWLGKSATDNQDDPNDLGTLERGTQSLEEWLTTGTEPKPLTKRAGVQVGAVGAVAVVIASALAGPPGTLPLLAAVALIAVAVAGVGYLASRSAAQDPRQSHEESFTHTGLEPPESWTQVAVRDRLTDLYDQIAETRFEAKRAERRDALLPDAGELEEQAANVEAQRSELKEKYGITVETTDVELLAITRGLIRLQEANAEIRGRETRTRWVRHLINRECEAISATLESYGHEAVSDAGEATKGIRNLETEVSAHDEATRNLNQAINSIQDAIDEIEGYARERRSIYHTLSLEDGAFEELRSLCERVEPFEKTRSEVGKQKRIVEERRADLETHNAFEASLLTTPLDELRDRKQEVAETADGQERLSKQITSIKTRIDDAKSDYELEPKLNERRQTLDELESRQESDIKSIVGDALVAHLREVTEASSRPAVFERAQETLIQITKGRYELDVDGGAFRVVDTVNERGFGLNELSSGSRLQVLLAVRLAFVKQQEQGVKLPLLLDETLANSDDERAGVIIESVLELARAGRQVFYFTAQGDEVAKWRQALQDVDVAYKTIDLSGLRGLDRAVELPDLSEVTTSASSLPDPESHDHTSYGEAIDVPAVEPRTGAGDTHLWYIVDELNVLHRLLTFGVERWGQLKTLLQRIDTDHLIKNEERLEDVKRNGAAIEEFVSCWQIGRGKAVDRPALEATSAVSSNFIERVSDLARSKNGDADAILEALRAGEVNRFRSGKVDELEQYFKENGYIEEREALDGKTILIRVVGRLESRGLDEGEAIDRAEALFDRLVERRDEEAVV